MEEFLAAARLVAGWPARCRSSRAFSNSPRRPLPTALAAWSSAGVDRVTVVPVLLFSAGHAKRDIPEAVAGPRLNIRGSPSSTFRTWAATRPSCALSNARYHEALRGRAAAPADASALVMVGRGSHDASATAEMHAFVAPAAPRSTPASVRTAFVAMAEPPLAEVLDEVSSLGVQRVVVVPHLLFGGVLVERIAAAVAQHAAQQPSIEWLVASHLGDSDLLARAVLARARPGCGW